MKNNWFLKQTALFFATLLSASLIGLIIAFFLWILEKATDFRNHGHGFLLYILPLVGVILYFVYAKWGKRSAKGNNLVIEETNHYTEGIPLIMTPLVLFGTVLTHFFGGSAGREGTAVQIGGSLADKLGKIFHLQDSERKILLISGIAAGFGAVFGTPLTGCIFALEVLVIGKMQYEGALHALLAAFVADKVCRMCGIHHTPYFIQTPNDVHLLEGWNLIKIVIAAVFFGLAANLFSTTIQLFKNLYAKFIPVKWLVPVCGAVLIILLSQPLGLQYIGLGVTPNYTGAASITGAFSDQNITTWSWLWKLLFTTITLSAGFKGGEVTPLFFIGAALGNTLAHWMQLPVDVTAGLGFIAVFAGATNTPIACCFMGLELFGSAHFPLYVIACFVAYYCNGYSGIYESQMLESSKMHLFKLSGAKTLAKYGQQRNLYFRRKWNQFRQKNL